MLRSNIFFLYSDRVSWESNCSSKWSSNFPHLVHITKCSVITIFFFFLLFLSNVTVMFVERFADINYAPEYVLSEEILKFLEDRDKLGIVYRQVIFNQIPRLADEKSSAGSVLPYEGNKFMTDAEWREVKRIQSESIRHEVNCDGRPRTEKTRRGSCK